MQFEVAVQMYWSEKRRNVSDCTVADYSVTFRRFAEFVKSKEVEVITANDVRRFLAHIEKQHALGKKTVCNAWVALSSFWSWAKSELEIEHVIHGKIERPQFRKPQIDAYTEDEVRAMLAACEFAAGWNTKTGKATKSRKPGMLRDVAAIFVLLDSGVRASELTEFKIQDYAENQGRLVVQHGKGDKTRVVFLGQKARKALRAYLKGRPGAKLGEPLFVTRTGEAMGRSELLHMIQRTAKRAGVVKANVHKFRHTFAINFLRNGGGVLQLQELLGHEKLDTVNIYVKLAEIDLAGAQRQASPADNWRL
ncbi:MAG: tyrosine-type recombinase/integrase [Cypionkella sp.]